MRSNGMKVGEERMLPKQDTFLKVKCLAHSACEIAFHGQFKRNDIQ